MIQTYKVMLVPNNKQTTKLFEYSGASRFAYNWALHKEMESLKNKRGFISAKDLRKEFTQLKKKKGVEWLNTISNNVTKQAIKDLVKAYIRFFKLRMQPGYKPYTKKQLDHAKRVGKVLTFYDTQGHPKFKVKRDVQRYGFYQDSVKIKFTETHVKVEGFSTSKRKNRQKLNWIKLAEKGRIPLGCKYTNPRITYDGIHWWISVGVEVDNKSLKYGSQSEGIGIDLGIKELAVCSDGNVYKNINKTKKIKDLEKRQKRLQCSISRKYENNKKKGGSYCKTKNIIKAEKQKLKIEHRLANIRKNYQLQTISEIINRKPKFIVIEDLNVSGMMQNKHLSKAVQDQGLREFRQRLENKSTYLKFPLVVADRWYLSSKLCNCCGAVKKDLKLSDRVYKCTCGYTADRDYNASKNLRDYAVNYGLVS